MNNLVLARRYATALFDEAKTLATRKKIYEEFKSLADVADGSKEFSALIKNPIISTEEKVNAFTAIFKKYKVNKMLQNFTILLVKNNRLDIFSSSCKAFGDMLMVAKGEINVVATFATKPTPALKKSVEKKVSEMTKKKVILDERVDPSLISGVTIAYGSFFYDSSVKGSIEAFKEKID